jgi:hypothetical protein
MSYGEVLGGLWIAEGKIDELFKILTDISKELEIISLELGSIRHMLEKEDK